MAEFQPPQYEVFVTDDHRIELRVPFPPGKRVRVFIVPADEESYDLMRAAESSTLFWDNPLDDDWNNA
jgi:hypothetical protein